MVQFLELSKALSLLTQEIQTELRRENIDLSVSEFYVVLSLLREGPMKASELAALSGRAPTAFTPVLDSIEKGGWIVRGKNESDRRAILLSVTEKTVRMEATFNDIAKRFD